VRNTALHMPSNLLAAFAPGAATIAADAHRLANVSKRAGRLIMQILFFAVGLSAIQMRLGPQSFQSTRRAVGSEGNSHARQMRRFVIFLAIWHLAAAEQRSDA
jgi:hypothetical protein